MGKIDYQKAHERICIAFCQGMLKQFGVRKMVKREIETEKPGRVFWEKGLIVTDEKTGQKVRKPGKLRRAPSEKVKHEIEFPQGVVPDEMIQLAEGMAAAFIEVLRIAEENGILIEESVVEAGVDNFVGRES